MSDLVLYEVSDGIGTITLNRPEKMNALNWDLINQLDEVWASARTDDAVRCVILTGAGKAFSAGDDMQQAWGGDQFEALMKRFEEAPSEPESTVQFEIDKPVVAAINGHCYGGAFEIALWADVVVASDVARFAVNFVEYGLIGGNVTFFRLPQLVGPLQASYLLLTGDRIDAQEALRIGLVTKVVPHDELMETARSIATTIASHPEHAVRLTKQGMRVATEATGEGYEPVVRFTNTALADVFRKLGILQA